TRRSSDLGAPRRQGASQFLYCSWFRCAFPSPRPHCCRIKASSPPALSSRGGEGAAASGSTLLQQRGYLPLLLWRRGLGRGGRLLACCLIQRQCTPALAGEGDFFPHVAICDRVGCDLPLPKGVRERARVRLKSASPRPVAQKIRCSHAAI